MPLKTLTLLLCLLAVACGAGDGAQNASAPSPAASQPPAVSIPRSATCLLISDDDFKEVQDEAPTDAQGSEHSVEGLSMSQCFFRLPTFAKSVNLEVVSGGEGSQAGAVNEYWRKRFHPDAIEAREQARRRDEEEKVERDEEIEREREAGKVREGGRRKKNREEEHWRPQRVSGVGREAFWAGNQRMWTLSALGRDKVVRVTLVGGPDLQAENLKKATALARKALNRL